MKKVKLFSIILSTAMLAGMLVGCGAKQGNENEVLKEEKETKEQTTEKTTDTGTEENKKEQITLRLADQSVYGIAIFSYANEAGLLDGYFDDIEGYDVKVELSEWASGVDQNTAFAAGQIDFAVMGNMPAVSGSSNGFGTKIIAVNYQYDNQYYLVAREGSGINSVEELKGKNVGTSVGTVTHYAIAKYLESVQLNMDDVNILNVGSETATSLRNGDIDAGILGNVVAHQIEEEGAGYILADKEVPIYNYVVGRSEFMDKYPEITIRVLQLINDTRALATKPEILLLDEPFGALDAFTRINMQEETLRIWEQEKTTMLLVTHDIDEAIYLSNRIIVLSAKPGLVKADIRVELSKPRERSSVEFLEMRRRVMLELFEEENSAHSLEYYI